MKLLGAALGVLAVQMSVVDAHKETQHIPFDCYTESRGYGNTKEGTKVTDKDLISGLTIHSHQMSSISVCTDTVSRLVSGVVTTWGEWNAVTNVWDNEVSLNTIGTMGMVSFDDNKALTDAGVATLSEGQMLDAQRYWYQEAAPEEHDFFILRRDAHLDQAVKDQWTLDRTTSFNTADVDSDGELTRWEAYVFLREVRALDGATDSTDDEYERMDQAMRVLNSFNAPYTSFKLSDYWRLQDTMLAWFEAGKLDATGHARGILPGEDLAHHCETVRLHGGQDDYVAFVQVTSNRHGVSQISVQTKAQPLVQMNNIEESTRYGFESQQWQRFVDTREFGGLWGTVDETTGNMNSLGFIAKEVACWDRFQSGLSAGSMAWDTPIPGTEQVLPLLDAANQSYLDTRTAALTTGSPIPNPVVWTTYAGIEVVVPVTDAVTDAVVGMLLDEIMGTETDHDDHEGHDDHDDHEDHEDHNHGDKKVKSTFEDHTHTVNASGGLVVFAVIIWSIVAIIGVIFLIMYCKERK